MKAQQKALARPATNDEKTGKKRDTQTDKNTAKQDANAAQKPVKLSYKHRYRLERLPQEMADLEAAIAKAEAVLADSALFTKDPQKFEANAAQLEASKADLAEAEDEWLQLELLREAAENGL